MVAARLPDRRVEMVSILNCDYLYILLEADQRYDIKCIAFDRGRGLVETGGKPIVVEESN